MKRKSTQPLIAAVLIITIFLAACEKEKTSGLTATSIGTPFKLAVTEKALVNGANNQVIVEAKYINDQRCTGCSTPGNAQARVVISNAKDATTETSMAIGMCEGKLREKDSVDVNLKGATYRLLLHNVMASPANQSPKAEFTLKQVN